MPELPEVETTLRGIAEHIIGQTVTAIRVNNPSLRWPVPVRELHSSLPGQKISAASRRAKYLLIHCGIGHLILHLGMSGSLRIVEQSVPVKKHDHVELVFTNGTALRFHDPRRFGAVLWTNAPPFQHPLLAALGPEPFADEFDGNYLFKKTRNRRCSIKTLIMDAHVVVGVGNIYASEALFHAGIRPARAASRLTRKSCIKLAAAIRQVLTAAISAGGTTLRDFTDSNGNAGYFKQSLYVYGRDGKHCRKCDAVIKHRQITQRSSFYCPNCQK